jgi:hypothetical protein
VGAYERFKFLDAGRLATVRLHKYFDEPSRDHCRPVGEKRFGPADGLPARVGNSETPRLARRIAPPFEHVGLRATFEQ